MTDFTIYQGVDSTPYYVVLDDAGHPVDVSRITEATWIAVTMVQRTITPVITKHLADPDTPITISPDPTAATNSPLVSDVAGGQYTISVVSTSGFAKGNTVTISDTFHSETHTIESVVGHNMITFTQALNYAYAVNRGAILLNITPNCIFVHISPEDTEVLADIGTFRHELRVTLDGLKYVVYPPVNVVATFDVVQSVTWDSDTMNPRVQRDDVEGVRVPVPPTQTQDKEIVVEKDDPLTKKRKGRELRDAERRKRSL